MTKVLEGELVKLKPNKEPLKFGLRKYDYLFLGEYVDAVAPIMIEKPLIKGSNVKEILTGVEFDSIYFGRDLALSLWDYYSYKSNSYKIESAVRIDDMGKEVSLEKLKEYIEEHEDIKAYKEYLEQLKVECHEIALKALNNKKASEEYRKNEEQTKRLLMKQVVNLRKTI